ncbi:MAG: hypothetical protein SNF92_09235 [Rikenellaceae bacterium]
MKAVKIENFIMLWYDECAVAYAQITNAICASDTLEELKDAIRYVLRDTDAGKYFVWGYTDNTFWLRQRSGYMDNELQDFNTLTVEFN